MKKTKTASISIAAVLAVIAVGLLLASATTGAAYAQTDSATKNMTSASKSMASEAGNKTMGVANKTSGAAVISSSSLFSKVKERRKYFEKLRE